MDNNELRHHNVALRDQLASQQEVLRRTQRHCARLAATVALLIRDAHPSDTQDGADSNAKRCLLTDLPAREEDKWVELGLPEQPLRDFMRDNPDFDLDYEKDYLRESLLGTHWQGADRWDPPSITLVANKALVTLHRVSLGWSKKRLAAEAGCSQSHVSRVEAGLAPLVYLSLADFARALGCTIAALCEPFTPSPDQGVQVQRNIAEWRRDRAWANANLLALAAGRLTMHADVDPRLDLPQLDPDDYAAEHGAATAAQVLRRLWRLTGPIKSIGELLDAAGIFVVIDDDFRGHGTDTVVLRATEHHPHLIYANGTLPPDRLRTALAVALGRIVMADALSGLPPKAAAAQVQAFADEFVAPIDDIAHDLDRVSIRTVHELYELRLLWGVSAPALVERAHKRGTLSDYRRRSLHRFLNETGNADGTRPGVARESATLASDVLTALTEAGYTAAELDRITLLPTDDRERLLGPATAAPRRLIAVPRS